MLPSMGPGAVERERRGREHRRLSPKIALGGGFFSLPARERGLALGVDLADQNVAWLMDGADTNDAAFIQSAKEDSLDVGKCREVTSSGPSLYRCASISYSQYVDWV